MAQDNFLSEARLLLGDGDGNLGENGLRVLAVFQEALKMLPEDEPPAVLCDYYAEAAANVGLELGHCEIIELDSLAVIYAASGGRTITHCLNCGERLALNRISGRRERCMNVSGGCEIAIGSCGIDGGDRIAIGRVATAWQEREGLRKFCGEFELSVKSDPELRGERYSYTNLARQEDHVWLFAVHPSGSAMAVIKAVHARGADCTTFESHAIAQLEDGEAVLRALMTYFVVNCTMNAGPLRMKMQATTPVPQVTAPGNNSTRTWEKLGGESFGWKVEARRLIIESVLVSMVAERRVLNLMCGEHAYIDSSAVSLQVGVDLVADTMRRNRDIDQGLSCVRNLNDPATVLPYEAEFFDRVVMVSGIRYLTNPENLFRKAADTLQPGGLFIVGFDESHVGTEHDSPEWRALEQLSNQSVQARNYLPQYRAEVAGPFIAAIQDWFRSAGLTPRRAICLRDSEFWKPYLFVVGEKVR